jgi:hypothetical protein
MKYESVKKIKLENYLQEKQKPPFPYEETSSRILFLIGAVGGDLNAENVSFDANYFKQFQPYEMKKGFEQLIKNHKSKKDSYEIEGIPRYLEYAIIGGYDGWDRFNPLRVYKDKELFKMLGEAGIIKPIIELIKYNYYDRFNRNKNSYNLNNAVDTVKKYGTDKDLEYLFEILPPDVKTSKEISQKLKASAKPFPNKKLKLKEETKNIEDAELDRKMDELVNKPTEYIYRAGKNWKSFDFNKGLDLLIKKNKDGKWIYNAGMNWKSFDFNKGLDALIKKDKIGKWICYAGMNWKSFDFKKGLEALKNNKYYNLAMQEWPKDVKTSKEISNTLKTKSEKFPNKKLKLKEESDVCISTEEFELMFKKRVGFEPDIRKEEPFEKSKIWTIKYKEDFFDIMWLPSLKKLKIYHKYDLDSTGANNKKDLEKKLDTISKEEAKEISQKLQSKSEKFTNKKLALK